MPDPFDLSAARKPPASSPAQSEPRIIVDSDWKQQAQAEREKLAADERKREAEGDPGGRAGRERMPPADFRTLVGSLTTQALLYLGGIPDPETGRAVVSLEYARHYIDLLTVIDEKTKGNLTPDEAAELTEVLAELRSRFVQISRGVAAAMAERAAGGRPGAPPPPA